ncbi:heparinase II/III family protein [Bdellovibrio sp.]|uniref:heparinase II/III domain-containing protein n=1 Tax=Bdellovibrio sp. TaxID=28201 RepID=UPI0039E46727
MNDWLVTTNVLAQVVRPTDCANVEQTPPDFRWPEVASSGNYQVTLTYPDGHTKTLTASQNWLNWDEVLPVGSYSWVVKNPAGVTSSPRKFVVDTNSKPFLVPNIATLLSTVSAKTHPRSLPEALTLEAMKSQRQSAINSLLSQVNGRIGQALPNPGTTATDCFNYSKYALASLQACVLNGQATYCNDAIARVMNLASWDPEGPTKYSLPAGTDMAARYLTWTVALGYDWLYSKLTSAQRTQILTMLLARNGLMYNDIIGTRSRISVNPRDSHGNQTLTIVAVVSSLIVGDLNDANTWFTNAIPQAVNAMNPWADEDGGFANAATQGNWDLGEMLPSLYQLRYATGIDVAQKPWIRNWGRYFAYFTPPGMSDFTTVFGDGFERNQGEQQARYGKGYTFFSPSPLGRWHMSKLSGEDRTRIEYLLAPPADFSGTQPFPEGTPNSIWLRSIGQVAMHSDLSNLSRTSVYFKSSPPPYGAFNHSHADQNSFVINSAGKRLAIESGYYDDYKTQHWLNWYHTTKAKNAITYDDGKGQVFYEVNSKMGFGNITGFTSTSTYDIVSGDATPAYNGALSKAQRSLVYLRPNLILVYDNLASSTSRQWEWNIHALNQMTSSSNTEAKITNGTETLCIKMLAGPTMQFSQHNVFSANPTNGGAAQWHGKFYNPTKTTSAEFVALLNVGCTSMTSSATKSNGTWTVTLGNQTVAIGSSGITVSAP